MKNNNFSSNEGTMRIVGNRFANVVKSLGAEAWDEFKGGVDKAWDEIKISMDESLNVASDGLNRGWRELSVGIERAKDSLLRNQIDDTGVNVHEPKRKRKASVEEH